MRALTVSLGAVAIIVAPLSTVLAHDHGGQTPKGNPHTAASSTTHGPSTTTHGPSTTTHGASSTTHGSEGTSHGPNKTTLNPSTTTASGTTTTTPTTTTTTTSTHGGHHESESETTSHTRHHETGSTTTPPGSTTTKTTHLNPIAQKISERPQLAARLQAMLPKGMTLNSASRGFKNQGQFIAALQASQKHNIPFKDLKAAMLGK